MIIDLTDPRVDQAIKKVKATHNTTSAKEFENIFESVYHCKIIPSIDNCPWALSGYLEISEEKYQAWFLLQFGGKEN
jgi:hypothetical protein